uniref:Uncharacterized protein n=1 Tax=Arundo donax TaxID=35708 RepID=A0A0A8YHP9_ARUDO
MIYFTVFEIKLNSYSTMEKNDFTCDCCSATLVAIESIEL